MSRLLLAARAADRRFPAEPRELGARQRRAGLRHKLVFRPSSPAAAREEEPAPRPAGQQRRSGRRGFPRSGGDPAREWDRDTPRPLPHRTNGPSCRQGSERKGQSRARPRQHIAPRLPATGVEGGGGAVRKSRRRGAISLPLPGGQAGRGSPGCQHPQTGGGGREGWTEGPGPDRW